MAGIEKMCEIDGDHCGWDMYNWKHNQLQIKPEYRKLFRGDKGKLVFEFQKYLLEDTTPGGKYVTWYNEGRMKFFDPPFKCEEEYKEYLRNLGYRFIKEYKYTYITDNPELQGRVEGEYVGFTRSPSTVIRKIKRLTRNYNLGIEYR